MPESLRALILSTAQAAGVQVYDIEYNGRALRVFIESDQGVTIDVCQQVSELLSARLDQSDLILGRYFLEVSSPGLERKLRGVEDFQRHEGKLARVVTHEGAFDGIIRVVTADRITLATPGPNGTEPEVVLAVTDIKRANLKIRDEELFPDKRVEERQ